VFILQNGFKQKKRVGGTKQIHIEEIRKLSPDLVIANKEENVQEQIEELAKELPVWISDVNTIDDACEMIQAVGNVVDKTPEANKIIHKIYDAFSGLNTVGRKLRACYLIWKEPYMTVGGDTFISHMMERAGFLNIYADKKRYPLVDPSDLVAKQCEMLPLSSEPYPFVQKHIDELKLSLPHTRMMLVDGEMFSWYGSRMLLAPKYFIDLRQKINN
jgi:ABC-type Fe3+-hydroxamate transport system substrate-binding protein